MRKTLLATAILVNALALGSTAGYADPMTKSRDRRYGKRRSAICSPGPKAVSPNTPGEQAEQQQMSTYDAEQQKLDEQLDRRLNICRGC